MARPRLDAAGEVEQFIPGEIVEGHDLRDHGPSDGQGPGLVERDRLHRVDGLEVGAALEDCPLLRSVRHCAHHCDGHGERKAAGARDHEDDKPAVDERIPLGAEEERRHGGDQHAEDKHGRRVPLPEGVREPLV